MSNMSYCRFQNTAQDLSDCIDHLYSLDPENTGSNNRAELNARAEIIFMAARILQEIGIDDIYDEMEIQNEIDLLPYYREDE